MKSETIWFGCLDAEERAMVSWVMRLGIFGVGKHYMEYQSRADLIELQSLIKNTADFNKKNRNTFLSIGPFLMSLIAL